MGDTASPLMLRRRLRTELRTARLEEDLTQEQVARAMEWSLSKMNRIEKAKTGISTNDLKALLPLYGITDKKRTQELLDLARTARQGRWWRRLQRCRAGKLLELIDYESAASTVHQFETTFVPGILQTEEYASAILQEFHRGICQARTWQPGRAAHQAAGPAGRREAPKFSFVLDESVVHRVVGSPAVTSKQFMHLVSTAELPSVTIQIVPFTAGLHPGMGGAFEVVEFDDTDDENIVFFEGRAAISSARTQGKPDSYLKAFKLIKEKSLAPADSVALLRRPRLDGVTRNIPYVPTRARTCRMATTSSIALFALHCTVTDCCCDLSHDGGSGWSSFTYAPASWLDTPYASTSLTAHGGPAPGGEGGKWPIRKSRVSRGAGARNPVPETAWRWRSSADRC